MENVKANNKEELSQKREERKQEEQVSEGLKLVIDQAKIKCELCTKPEGTLIVNFDTPTTQDKKTATVVEKDMKSLVFTGNCKKSPNMALPCASVMQLGEWQNTGTLLVQDKSPLLQQSTIPCLYGGSTIEITDSGQRSVPANLQAAGAAVPPKEETKVKILSAYFAKITKEAGDPIDQETEVYDKNLKKKVKVMKKVTTQKMTLEKISERGLSYQVALVVETEGLSGKKIKIKVRSGKKKVVSDVDATVKLINMKDVEVVTAPANYKTIKPQEEFEVAVDNYANDVKISNAADFKNKAILTLMLNHRTDDLSFELAELILADADKKAFLYIEVKSDEKDVEYKGKAGTEGLTNTFLNEEGQYFELKYKEQPWLITARQERKTGVTEATHCSRIIDEYHKINREHKPSGCTTITNAWCASFVGWCLSQNNFSAQLDPGAFSYGEIKTRYRASAKTVNGKRVPVPEKFDDPVWGKKTDNNKLAVGSVCVVNNKKHVTFAVAKDKNGTHFYGLGGNQGDAVKVSPYSVRNSSVFPIEYTIADEDYELPIYYRELTADTVA